MPPSGSVQASDGPRFASFAPIATRPRFSVVVSVFNAMRHLPGTVAGLLKAAGRFAGGAELLFVDNGSTDGSFEFLTKLEDPAVKVLRRPGGTVASVRNHGASQARGEVLAFIDADCVVAGDYFAQAVEVLERTGAVATGCETEPPTPPHWIEATWHELHYVGRDRFVHYVNSANFVIRADAFREIGGFAESLRTGEDSEIGQRIHAAGHRIYESPRVGVVHHGNPRTVAQFYRRTLWHAIGMFATVGWRRLDKPTAAMLVHLAATLAGLAALGLGAGPGHGLVLLLALQAVSPALTMVFRAVQTRRIARFGSGLFLYWVYYWARLHAFLLLITGRTAGYWQ